MQCLRCDRELHRNHLRDFDFQTYEIVFVGKTPSELRIIGKCYKVSQSIKIGNYEARDPKRSDKNKKIKRNGKRRRNVTSFSMSLFTEVGLGHFYF